MSRLECVVSVCAVVQNDAAIVEEFVREAAAELSRTYRYFEVVLVDNHSTDGTDHRVEALLAEIANIRLIRLSRVYSREVALSAALEHCIGDYVVTLDPRLDPVTMVFKMVGQLMSSWDVVIGRSRAQRGSWARNLLSRWSRRLAGRALGTNLETNTGHCLGFSRRAVNSLTRIHSKSRFIIYDCRVVGYRSLILEYDQSPRPNARASDDSLWPAAAGRAQMVISNSLVPLRLATLLGVLAALGNFAYLAYIFVVMLVKRRIAEGWLTTSLTHTVMFLVLFLILAILSEYVGRILEESKDQPLYFIEHEVSSTRSCYDKERLNIV